MGSKNNGSDIKLSIQSGGMMAFEKTGVLPMFLLFHSSSLQRSWRLKLKEDTQNGVLHVNGQVGFHYSFDGVGCKMQSLVGGAITEEWELEEILLELRD